MPIYEFGCDECKHEWEDFFQKSDPMPTTCPQCESENIKKLLSMCSGSAPLTGHDLTQHLAMEAKKIRRNSRTDENLKANLVGETKYNEAKTSYDNLQKEYKHKG